MAIGKICKTNVITISPEASLEEAAKKMALHHVGCLVVIEGFQNQSIPSGIITDRDLTKVLGSAGSDTSKVTVADIMVQLPVCAHKNDGVFEVTFKMREHGIKRIPILDELGSLYGIVSADDIIELISSELSHLSNISSQRLKKEKGEDTPREPRSSNHFN